MSAKLLIEGDSVWVKHRGIKRFGHIVSLDDETHVTIVLYRAYPYERELVTLHHVRVHWADIKVPDLDRTADARGHISLRHEIERKTLD